MTLNLAIPPDLVLPLAGYFILANLLALGLFALRRAQGAGEWTGAERRALFLALMGGWPGAQIGRLLFGRKEEPRGFGTLLGLSVLFLPLIVALPFLMNAAPGWIGGAIATYSAQYAQGSPDPNKTDASGVVASEGNATDAVVSAVSGAAVQSVGVSAGTAAAQANMPKRFGPVSSGKKSVTHKTLKVGD